MKHNERRMMERIEEKNRGLSLKSNYKPQILMELDIIIAPYYCIKNFNSPFHRSFFFRYS